MRLYCYYYYLLSDIVSNRTYNIAMTENFKEILILKHTANTQDTDAQRWWGCNRNILLYPKCKANQNFPLLTNFSPNPGTLSGIIAKTFGWSLTGWACTRTSTSVKGNNLCTSWFIYYLVVHFCLERWQHYNSGFQLFNHNPLKHEMYDIRQRIQKLW